MSDAQAAGGAPTPAPLTSDRMFDLNMQRVLEHWTVSEALREIIANALDEQALTNTDEPQVSRTGDGVWHVRDFGRGLRYDHFTQNEDPEKLRKPQLVIGKFGVGLKDAIATFDRHGIGVAIHSRHAEITIASAAKQGFDDVLTLHAVVAPPGDPQMTGTEFVLSGLSDEEVEKAKSFFLRYSDDIELEATRYGSVLQRESGAARIYVNGLRVAEEPNFLFSYNITSLTKGLRAALNRERSNFGGHKSVREGLGGGAASARRADGFSGRIHAAARGYQIQPSGQILDQATEKAGATDGRYIGEIEQGWHSPTIATVKQIADTLEVPLGNLVRDL